MITKRDMAEKLSEMNLEDMEAQKRACSNWLLNWNNFQHYTAEMFEKYPILPLFFDVALLVRSPDGEDAQFVSAGGRALESMCKAAIEEEGE